MWLSNEEIVSLIGANGAVKQLHRLLLYQDLFVQVLVELKFLGQGIQNAQLTNLNQRQKWVIEETNDRVKSLLQE